MTREEAIFCLKGIKNYGRDTFTSKSQSDWQGSLDMAIEALEQEPCEDAISRQAVLDLLENTNNGWIINKVLRLPSVNPQAPKTGHWITRYDRWGDIVTTISHYQCSECKQYDYDKDDYCPYCGAKMIEPQESEDKE